MVWDGRTIIETERLVLRTFRESDLPEFGAFHADPEFMRYLGGRVLPPGITDGIAAGAQAAFASTGVGKIAVERKVDGAFLGMAGLSVEEWFPDDLEVGWRIGRQYWGNGYASEAGAAWVRHAFGTLGAPRVISVADVPNRRSIAVMQRIGLRLDHEAELRDETGTFAAVIYAIDAAGWQAAAMKFADSSI